MKLLELKMKERELQLAFEKEIKIAELQQRTGRQESEGKEAVRNIKLVPKFNEKDVEKFFLHFEKLAESMEWSKSIWTVLLQSVLIGKAQEVYSALSVEQSTDYDVVKNTIMQAYELVPEAYRQKFRSRQKGVGETYVEFAREKETLFDRWCSSKEVGEDYHKLREVMLLEEFKNSVRREVKTHLEEQKVDTLRKAAKMADEYELTHKEEFVKKRENPYSREAQRSVGYNPRMESKYYSNRAKVETGETKMKSKSEGKVEHNERKEQKAFQGPTCYHCKKKGHVMSDCWFLKKADSKRATVNLVGRKASMEVKGLQESSGQKETGRGNTRCFESFISRGSIKNEKKDGGEKSVVILRDTGASQTLMSSSVLQVREKASEGDSVLIKGVGGDYKPVPLQKVYLKSDLVTGPVEVGIVSEIPVEGVDMLLGNDLAGDRVKADPHMCKEPSAEKEDSDKKSQDDQEMYQACVVTRSMKMKEKQETNEEKNEMGLENTFMNQNDGCESDDESKGSEDCEKDDGESEEIRTVKSQEGKDKEVKRLTCDRLVLIQDQRMDLEVRKLRKRAVTVEEAKTEPVCYFEQAGVLMRKWRPPEVPREDEWKIIYQIVLPEKYRKQVLEVAHELPTAGHLGVRKTENRIMQHFYWPKMKRDVADFCRTCHTCQMIGKPNQKIKPAPLQPITSIGEPFGRVIIDCVGPLPKSKTGNKYLLTIMCVSTRFPEAVPLRKITAPVIVNALTKFFTVFGMPKEIQTDLGSNFTSGIFQQVMHQLQIKHVTSSAYHPQSQGALERYHQTLKTMMKAYCFNNQNEWDEGIHLLLFATREVVQESLGFSPFELVFGHTVRGPLKALKEKWLNEDQEKQMDLLDYVCTFKNRLQVACKAAQENLKRSQQKMKEQYDKGTKERQLRTGDKVLILLPVPGEPLRAKFCGPYEVEKKVNDLNYVVSTPDRRKTKRLCHINMLKQYFERQDKAQVASVQRYCENANTDQSKQKTIRWKERKKKTKSLKGI